MGRRRDGLENLLPRDGNGAQARHVRRRRPLRERRLDGELRAAVLHDRVEQGRAKTHPARARVEQERDRVPLDRGGEDDARRGEPDDLAALLDGPRSAAFEGKRNDHRFEHAVGRRDGADDHLVVAVVERHLELAEDGESDDTSVALPRRRERVRVRLVIADRRHLPQRRSAERHRRDPRASERDGAVECLDVQEGDRRARVDDHLRARVAVHTRFDPEDIRRRRRRKPIARTTEPQGRDDVDGVAAAELDRAKTQKRRRRESPTQRSYCPLKPKLSQR